MNLHRLLLKMTPPRFSTYCGGVIGGQQFNYPNNNNLAYISNPANTAHVYNLANMTCVFDMIDLAYSLINMTRIFNMVNMANNLNNMALTSNLINMANIAHASNLNNITRPFQPSKDKASSWPSFISNIELLSNRSTCLSPSLLFDRVT
jgi:hypothetical protein